MAINKKFIHFKRKSTFQRELEAGNILNTSIVFIADAKQIYLNGSYFSENTLFNLSDLLNEVSGDLTSTDTSNEAIVKLYKYLKEVDSNTDSLIKILMQEVSTLEETLTNRIDNTDLTLATELSRIDQEIDNSKNLVNITYSELKSLRDSSKLIPGMQYRITDYEFTTTNDRMMAKPSTFDIIVTADDDHTLNESARAVARENVAAIPESRNYAAWELKYTIDNVLWSVSTEEWIYTDLEKEFTFKGTIKIDGNEWKLWYNENFDPELGEGETYGYCATLGDIVENKTSASLVDIDNKRIVYQDCISILRYNSGNSEGKGTILWLKDEYLNEAYYDHHNALIKTYKVTACEKAPDVVGMYVMSKTDGTTIDNSDIKWMPSFGAQCYKNKYGKYLKQETSRDKKICINVLYDNCISNTFGDNSYSNTFNTNCGYNTFGTNSYNNTFNKYCSNNTIGEACVSITFGSQCYYNIFGSNCGSTIFESSCSSNTFGGYCYNTTFRYECSDNIFSEGCSNNTFGHGCGGNAFGSGCYNNTFGDRCGLNVFNGNCCSNTFGEGCYCNTFENSCMNLKIGTSITNTYVHAGTNNQRFVEAGNETTLTINFLASKNYCQHAGINSSGELKIWNPADLNVIAE